VSNPATSALDRPVDSGEVSTTMEETPIMAAIGSALIITGNLGVGAAAPV
jgi:hypothetical protein